MAVYTNTLEGLCTRVYARLADDITNPGTWDKCQVETAIVDSLWLLAALRPGIFTETQPIELSSNLCVQTLPDECPSVSSFTCIEIDGQQTPIIEGDFKSIEGAAFHPPSRRCNTGNRRSATNIIAAYHVAVNPDNPRTFAISPIVPAGSKAIIYADCVSITDFALDRCKELPEEIRPYIMAIVELALYTLYSTDREAPEVAALANMSLQTFLSLTSLNISAVNNVIQQQRRLAGDG